MTSKQGPLTGPLPQGMNSPQKVNYGLYGEQLSGTAFTAPSHQNERTWCTASGRAAYMTYRDAHDDNSGQCDHPSWHGKPCLSRYRKYERRGFVCENYGQKFHLPARGSIGAKCMANPRDFKTPVAAFEDRKIPSTITIKLAGQFPETKTDHSPIDVVAWRGNYAPCK